MAVVVSDAFDRTDGPMGTTNTGQAWVQSPGSGWAIAGGKAKATAASHATTTVESNVSNCTISVEVSATNAEGAIAWRVSDTDNFWFLLPLYNSVYKKVAGSFVSASSELSVGTGAGTWSVELSGGTTIIKRNGVSQLTLTDTFNQTATKHGLYSNDTVTTFDTFQITVPDTGGAPVTIAAPISSGTAEVGAVLSCTNGTWTNSPTGYAYQWRRSGTPISGATSSTYTVVAADQGATLTCAVTATNVTGSSTATSNGIVIPSSGINIAPNDTNILYSPYNWNVNANRALTAHPGAYFRAVIQGSPTAINANFDVAALLGEWPQLSYRVDDGPWTKVTIAATVALPLPPSTAAWTVHVVEVVVKGVSLAQDRWTSAAAAIQLAGLSTVPNTCTTRPVYRRPLDVIMYGDSVTQGVLAVKPSGGTPEIDAHDAMQSWGWRLTETLGAEVGVVAYGGQGWAVPSSGTPSFANSWDKLTAAITRDLTTPAPDWVVIVHGQNDISGDVATVVTSTLNAILAAIPATTAVAVTRPVTGTQEANIQIGIAACSAPERVTWVDTTGWWAAVDSSDGSHPWGYAHVGGLAPRLAQALVAATPDPGPPDPDPPPQDGVVWPITATVIVR